MQDLECLLSKYKTGSADGPSVIVLKGEIIFRSMATH